MCRQIMQAQVSGDAGTLPINPQIVVDAAGNARAMWVRCDASERPELRLRIDLRVESGTHRFFSRPTR
jgi:hypothetical protein